MKIRLLAFIFNFYSISAVAGYECNLKLAHSEDLDTVIAEKTISIDHGRMSSGNVGTLFVESETNKKRITLDINAVMSGWRGEEDASFVIIRRATKKRSVSSQTISEIMTVVGDDRRTGWFDSYKLDIACAVEE